MVDAQAETLSAVTIRQGQDFKAFEEANGMFVGHTIAGNLAVVTFFFFCKFVMLAALDRKL